MKKLFLKFTRKGENKMFDMKQIGKNITNLRKTNNMTQMELADKLGISFQAVSNWERGNTMPDISKLPELAEIFHISVDELLNEKASLVNAVLNNAVDTYIEEGKISEQDITNTLPLLKPEQAEELIDKVDVSAFHDISSLLPFINSETLAELAKEYLDQGNAVNELLPFLDEEDVTEIVQKLLEKGADISYCLPFMHEEDVAGLAFNALEQKNTFSEYLPFMHKEDITAFANKLIERGESINCILPFLYEDDIRDLAVKTLESGNSIDEYLPFMNEDDVTQLALKILRSKQK